MGALVLAVACGNDDDGEKESSCSRACQTVAPCEGVTQAECEDNLCPLIFSASCLEAIEAATCADTVQEVPSYNDLCFPPCTEETGQMCRGDDISLCAPFPDRTRRITAPCSFVCAEGGGAYSGTCGSSYQGQQSSTGGDVCFCL